MLEFYTGLQSKTWGKARCSVCKIKRILDESGPGNQKRGETCVNGNNLQGELPFYNTTGIVIPCVKMQHCTLRKGRVAILHRVFPLPCPAVTRVPVGKSHRIGPFPVLQFTQVWLFLAYLQLYAGCFPHRKMVVECTGCSWLNTQVCVVKLHRLYLLLI